MNLSPSPRAEPSSLRLPKSALLVMLVIVVAMALLALYANVQRWRRDKIENVIVIPPGSPSPAAP
ncbi:MAG: hypothetical protein DME49_11230 [Verrucomicrobia bacterium]|nr:MAG: hypothetical protein DME49_11230 [Verrucomicrobiota bacterium]PYK93853.1 MAG: hypothetical protein DME36_07910 [Verrucomicrobiota bacterium]